MNVCVKFVIYLYNEHSSAWTDLFLRLYIRRGISCSTSKIMFPPRLPRVLSLVICAVQRQCSSTYLVGHARSLTDYEMRHAPLYGASAEAEFSPLSYHK